MIIIRYNAEAGTAGVTMIIIRYNAEAGTVEVEQDGKDFGKLINAHLELSTSCNMKLVRENEIIPTEKVSIVITGVRA